MVLQNKILKFCQFMFAIQLSSLGKGMAFNWKNFKLLHPCMLCAEIGRNWPSGSIEDFQISSIVFFKFHYYLPLEKGGALCLNKHEFSSPQDALCHVWLKLAQWFWRRRLFNFVNVFLLFRKLHVSPLRKRYGPLF